MAALACGVGKSILQRKMISISWFLILKVMLSGEGKMSKWKLLSAARDRNMHILTLVRV
jgi:hypothetical protein